MTWRCSMVAVAVYHLTSAPAQECSPETVVQSARPKSPATVFCAALQRSLQAKEESRTL